MFTFTSYGLAVVALLHVMVLLSGQWSVGIRATLSSTQVDDVLKATAVFVTPAKFSGAAEIVSVERRPVVSVHLHDHTSYLQTNTQILCGLGLTGSCFLSADIFCFFMFCKITGNEGVEVGCQQV